MDCHEFVNLMSSYVDGDLALDRAAEWQQHFQHCPECGQFFKSFQSSRDMLRFLKKKPCPIEITKRLHSLVLGQLTRRKEQPAGEGSKSD